jgi:NAD(P)-dependent dehydrogenase (short-subunit alcohol dehydrogenase family)
MGKVVLITGSGRGIGASAAKLAASRGWDVCVNYLNKPDRAEAVVAEIRKAGGKAIAVQADTSNEADVKRLFEKVDAELGRLDALVNNAGIVGKAGKLDSFDAAGIRRVFDVNVLGTFLCTQQAAKRMSTKHGGKGGAIVNVSSVAAVLGGANQWLHYAAAKGAVNTLTVGLAKELAPEGIRVNAVMPGLIDTEIHAEAGVADRLQKVIPQVPMGRIGTPEECAEAIVWLMSGEAAYMVGAIVPLTGGR